MNGTLAGSTRPGTGPLGAAAARVVRELVLARLGRIEDGFLEIRDGGEVLGFGDPGSELRASVHVEDRGLYLRLLQRGSVGAGEAYLEGEWWSPDPVAVIRVLARNRAASHGLDSGAARLAGRALRVRHRLRRNTRRGSRRNIAAHYDLGNDFFELFLDRSLTYSCAFFEAPEVSLEAAQEAKLDRICRKLDLRAGDRVLEIGTGWGSFALHAAARYGCHVTTTTISRRQHELAAARVARAGLQDRVRVLLEDYRDVAGRYDKLVSIEMVEAVGADHLETFFRVCGECLHPHGRMALQAITVLDRDYESSRRNVDFIKRYIFPGGQLVSLGALARASAAASDLQLEGVEDLTAHYAETLRRWRERFLARREAARELGLDDRFLRMWEYYLAYCEGGFAEGQIGVVQGIFRKPRALPAPIGAGARA